ncbi:MAG: rhodanese-like domain-containing protein [Gemmatimonadales bacterium]
MTTSKRLTTKTIVMLVLLAGVIGGLLWDGSPLGSLAVRTAVHLRFKDVRQVTPAEVVSWMRNPSRQPPLLIDSRPPTQFQLSHIAGAVEIDPTAPDLAPLVNVARDIPLVVYDGPGVVSAAMVQALLTAGFSRVSHLEGGLFRWANEGQPIADDQGPATKVDPVNWWWGRLLKGRYRP